MTKNLNSYSKKNLNVLLNLIVESLPYLNIPDDNKERDEIFYHLNSNENDKNIILNYFLDILFYIPNVSSIPGISYENMKVIQDNINSYKIDINKQKENIIMFLSKRVFPLENILIHYIIGSTINDHNV